MPHPGEQQRRLPKLRNCTKRATVQHASCLSRTTSKRHEHCRSLIFLDSVSFDGPLGTCARYFCFGWPPSSINSEGRRNLCSIVGCPACQLTQGNLYRLPLRLKTVVIPTFFVPLLDSGKKERDGPTLQLPYKTACFPSTKRQRTFLNSLSSQPPDGHHDRCD